MSQGLDTLVLDPDGTPFSLVDGISTLIDSQAYDPTEPNVLLAQSIDTAGARAAHSQDQNVSLQWRIRVMADDTLPEDQWDRDLERRVALIQAQMGRLNRELSGVLKRTSKAGTVVYYDLVAGARAVPSYSEGDGTYEKVPDQWVTVTLPALPYARTDAVTVALTPVAGRPLYIAACDEIPGDVPALGVLVVANGSTTNKQYLRWGCEQEPGAGTALFFEAESLTPLGASTVVTRPPILGGPSGNKEVQSATIGSDYLAVLTTGKLTHSGGYRALARIAGTSGSSVRWQWGTGDAVAVTLNDPVVIPGTGYAVLDLGEIQVDGWAGTLLAKNGSITVDWIALLPIDRSGIAEAASVLPAPSTYAASDEFTGSGNLAGSAATVGGTWAGTGATGDFTRSSGVAQRTTTSDTSPRLDTLPIAAADLDVSCLVTVDGYTGATGGVVAREVDGSDYLAAHVVFGTLHGGSKWDSSATLWVQKVIGGSVSTLATVALPQSLTADLTLSLRGGSWSVTVGGSEVASGSDPDLAPGGVLASGGVGLYDQNSQSTARTRTYDHFTAAALLADAVIFAGRSLTLASDGVTRQSSDGTVSPDVARYSGDRLTLGPGTPRLMVLADDADPPLGAVETGLSATLTVTPRYLLTP